MQVFYNGKVLHYKQAFPNVSFSINGPSDEFLSSHNAFKISLTKEHDQATQKLVPCDPVVENGWAYIVKVENKAAEEIAADVASKAALLRDARDVALTACDWTQLGDSPLTAEKRAEWAIYRQALRDLPTNSEWPRVDLPTAP